MKADVKAGPFGTANSPVQRSSRKGLRRDTVYAHPLVFPQFAHL